MAKKKSTHAVVAGLHLRSIEMRAWKDSLNGNFPFTLPAFRTLQMTFNAPVTFFVGENGSGKSTLMETIACAADMVTVGSANAAHDQSLTHVRILANHLRLTWSKRTRKGFFLRAEDFFGYAKRLNQTRTELEHDLLAVEDEYAGRSETAKGLARMPYASELGDIQRRYGAGLDVRSHGESFIALFQSRFVPGGLYLLDEPEAPLSPVRQLTLLTLLKQMTAQNAQFIIATHSPIVMAYPGAAIWNFANDGIQTVQYDEVQHVSLTRDFLNRPEAYLRHLED
jgi:predicted ATPase